MKKMIALLLAVVLTCSLFAACGSNKESASGANKQSAQSAAEQKGNETKPAAEQTADEEPYEIIMTYLYWGAVSPDLPKVEARINEMIRPKINAKVSFLPLSFSEMATQPGLMVSSGEKLDLMLCMGQSAFLDALNKNMVLQLDDLYEKYGQGIADDLGEVISGGYMDGKLYGIPSTRTHANSYGIFILTDYVNKYGLDTSKDISYEELDEFFAKVKEGEADSFYPLLIAGSNVATFEDFVRMDVLGADMACGGIIDYHNSKTVVDLFETDEYKNHLDWMRKWYLAGYINSDAATNTDNTQVLLQNGLGASYLMQTYWDMEENQEITMGVDLTMINLTGDRATSDVYQGQTWCIPYTCENPEATMQFLNLLYEDVDVLNTLYWGIEGEHYIMTDDPGIVAYPEGVDAMNTPYLNMLGLYGAVDKRYQTAPFTSEYFKKMEEYNASISDDAKSPFMGYAFNTKNVKNEYAAVTDVLNQYRTSLETGSVDPDAVLPEFISALKTAGIDTIIAENQKKLDEWLANK